ncbi:hypothetical protein R6Q57_003419 [Mikania cordata]
MDVFLHHYIDFQRCHNSEYWKGIKLGIQADCANRYKDRKTKLKKDFDKHGGYDDTERAKTSHPEGIIPYARVRVTEELFTTPTYQNSPKKTHQIIQNNSIDAIMGHNIMRKGVTLK